MLPLGKIGIRGEIGSARNSNLTPSQQRTLMTLWSIFRSPLMFGGHLPDTDRFVLSLITNPEILAVNQYGSRPRQLDFSADAQAVWVSDATDQSGRFVALFNLSDQTRRVECSLADLELGGPTSVRDLWQRAERSPARFDGLARIASARYGHVAGSLTVDPNSPIVTPGQPGANPGGAAFAAAQLFPRDVPRAGKGHQAALRPDFDRGQVDRGRHVPIGPHRQGGGNGLHPFFSPSTMTVSASGTPTPQTAR